MMGISGLHHIAILCSDKERSIHFYGVLGFHLLACHARPERGDKIVMMEGHGMVLELFIDPKHPARVTNPEAMGLRHLALRVEHGRLASMLASLRNAGIIPEPLRYDSFTGEPMTFVMDPDGLPVELHE